MSVLIRGMEIPTSCADCRLMADGWCYSVGLEQREKISTVKRPTWCPLVSIPKHGRLIDADVLMELYADTDDLRLKDMKVPIAVIRQNIMDMQTIIPADEPFGKSEQLNL